MGVGEFISSIIVNIISSLLYDQGGKLVNYLRENKVKEKIDQRINFLMDDDSSGILSSDLFLEYLQQHNPEKLIAEHFNREDKKTDEIFIKEISDNCTKYFAQLGKEFDAYERSVVEHFFKVILDEIKSQLEQYRTAGEIALSHQMNESYADITTQISDLRKQIQNQQNIKRISTAEAIEILDSIIDLIFSGDIKDVYQLFRQIENKNSDLDKAAVIIFAVTSNLEKLDDDQIIAQWKTIDNSNIKNLSAEILIYTYGANNTENSKQLSTLEQLVPDEQLKTITHAIIQNDYSTILNESKKNGSDLIQFAINSQFTNHKLLINHLLVYYFDSCPFFNKAQAIKDVTEKSRNFIDNLYIWKNRLIDISRGSYTNVLDKSNAVKTLKAEILSFSENYKYVNKKYREYYYELLLQCSFIIDDKDISETLRLVPQDLFSSNVIFPYVLIDKVRLGQITEKQIFEDASKYKCPELIQSYLVNNADPHNAADILGKYPDSLTLNFNIFQIYIHSLEVNNDHEKVEKALNDFKEYYKDYLPYWLEAYWHYLRINNEAKKQQITNILISFEKEQKRYYTTSISDFLSLACALANENQFDLALNKVKLLNTLGIESDKTIEIKAQALIEKNKNNEALKLLNDNFELVKSNRYCIEYIISYSLQNQREIAPKVVKAAITIGSSRLLSLASIYHKESGNNDEAKELAIKSMLITPADHEDLFDNLLSIFANENDKTVTKDYVEADTFVIMENGGKVLNYCIYEKNLLPQDKCIWKNATHIYKDSAVLLNLFGKKVGDTVIIGDCAYKISEILSINVFYFRVCMDSMISRKHAWEYHFSDADTFTDDLLKEYEKRGLIDRKDQFKMLYQNFTKLPVSLYLLKRQFNLEYGAFIRKLLQDSKVIVREIIDDTSLNDAIGQGTDSNQKKEYILTYSALNVLFELGIQYEDLKKYDVNIYVPCSAKKLAAREQENIYRENDQRHVGSLNVEGNHIVLYESTNDTKRENILEAIKFKKFVESFPSIENTLDIEAEGITTDSLHLLLSICDYDALSIAHNNEIILISFEPMLIYLTKINGAKAQCLNIEDFLCNINFDIENLLDILQKLYDFRFQCVLTPKTILYIANKYKNIPDDASRKKINERYVEVILKPQDLGDDYVGIYKSMGIISLRTIPDKDVDNSNPIISEFIKSILYYNKIQFEYFIKDHILYYRFVKNNDDSAKEDSDGDSNPD